MHAPKLVKACGNLETDRQYSTGSHKRRKGEQATFRMVSIYGRERSGKTVLYAFATNTSLPSVSAFGFAIDRFGRSATS